MGRLIVPTWYKKLEEGLQDAWPLEVLAASIIVLITVGLVLLQKRVLLAGWLVWMALP